MQQWLRAYVDHRHKQYSPFCISTTTARAIAPYPPYYCFEYVKTRGHEGILVSKKTLISSILNRALQSWGICIQQNWMWKAEWRHVRAFLEKMPRRKTRSPSYHLKTPIPVCFIPHTVFSRRPQAKNRMAGPGHESILVPYLTLGLD